MNQESNDFYLVAWKHKDKQQKTIESLSQKLREALRCGMEDIIEKYFSV
jgi:hypothetical protein